MIYLNNDNRQHTDKNTDKVPTNDFADRMYRHRHSHPFIYIRVRVGMSVHTTKRKCRKTKNIKITDMKNKVKTHSLRGNVEVSSTTAEGKEAVIKFSYGWDFLDNEPLNFMMMALS